MSDYLDRSLVSKFFGNTGQLVPLETFSFMFDLLDDLEALEMLDWICKLQGAGCHYYCPMDSCPIIALRVYRRPWDSIGCRYIQVVQPRLRHWTSSFSSAFGWADVQTALEKVLKLRCAALIYGICGAAVWNVLSGMAVPRLSGVVWHKEETGIGGSVVV